MQCTDHDHHIPQFTPTSEDDNLKDYIDVDKVEIFNSKYIPRSNTFKNFINNSVDTGDNSTVVESDCDNQMLLVIPFHGPVTLFSIIMDVSSSEGHPKHINMFKDLDSSFNNFNTILSRTPDQSLEASVDSGMHEYPLDRTRTFKSIQKVHILLPDNWQDDEDLVTRISYLEIRGCARDSSLKKGNDAERTKVFFKPPQYEALGNPKDHKKNETSLQMLNI